MLDGYGCRLLLRAIVIAVLVTATSTVLACVGARPLAMGGAFTGLADDVNATYWNPAGLTQLKSTTGTVMHTTTNRDEVNYQDYLAFVVPLQGVGTVGVSWIKDNMRFGTLTDEENWYWTSFACKIDTRTSVGANLKYVANSIPGFETEIGIDLGFLLKIDNMLTIGMLVQNINQPTTTSEFEQGAVIWKRNWRPGCSIRPDKTSVATFEIYDALENSRSFRFGFEKQMANNLAVRGGFYGLGNSGNSAITLGFGVGVPNERNPVTVDVAAMLGDINTVLTSATMKF